MSLIRAAICLIVALGVPYSAGAEQTKPHKPRIGLVLSGGGARGAAHIGVLRVLETLRVPISCIVGTSIGAIVGGAYAAGAPIGILQKTVSRVNLDALFIESPRRQDQSILDKLDDQSNFVTPELGWRDGNIQLPAGTLSGVALEGVIRNLTPIQRPIHFDKLPIPFRAIATDIVTGAMVVLDHGELHLALRASMSVPSVLAPVDLDGRLLVDGGLVRNLGVDVARDTCADVVIAVNLGTTVAGREELDSLVGIAGQVLTLLTDQNVNRSKSELQPQDILIEPILDDFTAADFDKLPEIVPRGETAARLQASALRRLSVSRDEYNAFRRRQATAPETTTVPVVTGIEIHGLKRTHPDAVRSALKTRIGDPVNSKKLASDMALILDRDDFSRVDYRLAEKGDGQVVNVYPIEKPWGPNYVQAGLKLASDFQGSSDFSLLARYRRTWLNRAGAEWRTNLQLGRDSRLNTQWFQPLSAGSDYFVLAELEYRRDLFDAFEGRQRVGRFAVDQYRSNVFAGRKIGSSGITAIALARSFIDPSLQIGSPDLFNPGNVQVAGFEWLATMDTLDNLNFPTRGVAASARLFSSSPGFGADFRYTVWNLSLDYAKSFGPNELSAHILGGGTLRGTLPVHESMSLGGFHRLSGLRRGQYIGDDLQYARLTLTRRPKFLQGWRIGASVETGRIRNPLVQGNPTGFIGGASIFVGKDTALGPVYLAFGIAEHGNRAAYFYLGRP